MRSKQYVRIIESRRDDGELIDAGEVLQEWLRDAPGWRVKALTGDKDCLVVVFEEQPE